MKICFAKSSIFLPYTGAEISMFERLELLQAHGFETVARALVPRGQLEGIASIAGKLELAVRSADSRLEYEHCGVSVMLISGEKVDASNADDWQEIQDALEREILRCGPDFVFVNVRDTPALLLAHSGRLAPAKAIYFLTEDEYFRAEELQGHPKGPAIAKALSGLQKLVVSCEFLETSYFQSWGVRASVFLNSVNVSRYRRENRLNGRLISCMHPYTHKGLDIVLQLADALPNRPFCIPGGAGADYRKRKPEILMRKNIEHARFTPRPTVIYAESRLVLVPSLWEEVFPRVVVEALAAERPVLVADTGGVRSAGGDAGIYLPVNKLKASKDPAKQNVAPWLEAIMALDDPGEYRRWVEKARERTAWYEKHLESDISRLAEWISA